MKIIGYMVVGPGEADRYLESSLIDLKRLVDKVIICMNRTTVKEDKIIRKYADQYVYDDREWGKKQHIIKQEFVSKFVVTQKPDILVTKDADEIFDSQLTREHIENLKGDSWYFYVVNMWDNGYAPEMCFWNVRIWRNIRIAGLEFENQPLHCGLSPKWTYKYGNYAPFILKHYGLKDRENRLRKVARYELYDPNKIYKSPEYYNALKSNIKVEEFNENNLHDDISNEVKDYKIKYFKHMEQLKQKYYYVKNPAGVILDIPEKDLEETIARDGFELISKEPVIVGGGVDVQTTTPASQPINENLVEEPVQEDDVLMCDICGFIAKSNAGLAKHSKTHE